MRLIDADRIFKLLKEHKEKETGAFTKGINKGLNIAKCIVKDETQSPTAYNVEKANGCLEANWKLGYQKAIEDFTEKAKAECRKHYVDCDPYFGGIIDSILYEDDIDEIAEQLKEGVVDE